MGMSHGGIPTSTTAMKPLASGAVPLPIAKQFLTNLYTALIFFIQMLPGTLTRLLATFGTLVTFQYTQHLKPKTWLKNLSCASILSLSPVLSGFATTYLMAGGANRNIIPLALQALGPMTLALLFGFIGREIMMDIQDYDSDKAANISTVPVRYGRRFSTQVILGCMSLTGLLTVLGPLIHVLRRPSLLGGSSSLLSAIFKDGPLLKLMVGLLGSGSLIRGAYRVHETEGRDLDLVSGAVEAGKLSIIFILATFL